MNKKSNSDQGNFSSLEFIHTLNKYIPSLVLQQWIDKIDVSKMVLPELQTQETVVLFADISGFTNISEACALMGIRGNEELAFCINRYMEGMVKALGKYGGDIIKFVGDAMIVMWPRINHSAYAASYGGGGGGNNNTSTTNYGSSLNLHKTGIKDHGDDRVTVIRKAIQCALEIQNELNDKKIMNNVTNLSVKIGIGYGDCALLYVGGVFNRAEFFTVGAALTSALQSEENASAGGQIIVSQSAYQYVEQFFQSDEIINDHGKKFYRILTMNEGIRMRADAVLLRNLIQADNFLKIQNKLKACIPAAIMPYLEIGYEQYGSETRRLSIMFASLGVDLSSAQTVEGMNKIQKIVTTVQQQVYRLEGSLNKLVMDDKGSTLICIWGLSPFAHEDDAARAILTAMNIRRELAKIENTWCNVGISTGEVFSGVVGTSGSRKEFSVLGDYVNLAARIMYHPKKYKLTGKIYVDLQTKKEADNYLRFIYQCHSEFKGKSTSLPIFEPLDPLEELSQANSKILGADVLLKIHSNPFLVDRNSEYKRKVGKQVGRQDQLYNIQEDLLDYFHSDNRPDLPYMLAIYGESGSGKTLFAKCLVEALRKNNEFLNDLSQEDLPFLTSALNAETQMRFLNGWRPILQSMLFIHCKKRGLATEKYISSILKGLSQDKADIILDIFNIKSNINKYLNNVNDPLAFVKREKYSEDEVETILDVLIDFIIEVINDEEEQGEAKHIVNSLNESNYSRQYQQNYKKQKDQSYSSILNQYTPLILIFDTVYLLDEPSWKLLDHVKEECTRIAVIMLTQTDTVGQPKIHSEAVSFYQEVFLNTKSAVKTIDLPALKSYELEELLVDLSPQYQQQMLEEIFLQTKIDDIKTTIKNPEQCKLKEVELKKKHLVSNTYSSVSQYLLDLMIERCEGNPLTSLNFVYNMMTNDFLVIRDNQLRPGRNFLKAQKKSDWSIVPVPAITQKINCTLLDSYLKEMKAKQSKIESENGVKGLLILKSAAVIGDMFGTRALQHICPMRNQSNKSIMSLLRILEQKDFIEILDETDPKNAICRFRKCFLRETIYQAMLYRDQKKGLHELMAQFIQNNPSSFESDPEIEAEKLLNHILISEDIDREEKVPFKSKQALIVKKISNILLKNPNAIVKSGMLTKQGNKPNKNTEQRLMVIRARGIFWFHDESEIRSNQPLGAIPLQSVYHCMPAKGYKNTSDIIIGTCFYSKKGIDKESKREFIFGAKDSIERDEWISCIEYMRAKCIYDSFVSRYCNITFPLKKASEEENYFNNIDYLGLSKDFGSRFKIQARFNQLSPEVSPKRNSRPTSKRSSKFANKLGSFAVYNNINDVKESPMPVSTFNNPKDIAQRIKRLYSTQMATFVSHITSNADKHNHQTSDSIRKLPQHLKNTLIYDDPSEMHSMINKQISSSLSVFSTDEYNEQASLRRISMIARREVMEDNSEFKSYLEELKELAVGNSINNNNTGIIGDGSASPRIEHMKITEENEEYSESSNNTSRHQNLKHKRVYPQIQQKQNQANNQPTSHQAKPRKSILKVDQESREVIANGIAANQQKKYTSRLSKQLAMGPSQVREMTFHQQQQNELLESQQQQTFAINVSPTKQPIMFDKIEEQDESQIRSSLRSRKKYSSPNNYEKQQTKTYQKQDTAAFNMRRSLKQQLSDGKHYSATAHRLQDNQSQLSESKAQHDDDVSQSVSQSSRSQQQQQLSINETINIDQLSQLSQSITSSMLSLQRRDASPTKSVKQNTHDNKAKIQDSATQSNFERDPNQSSFTMQYASNSQPQKNSQLGNDILDSYGSQRSGGAASSKGVQMAQIASKQSVQDQRAIIEDDKILDPDQSLEKEEKQDKRQLLLSKDEDKTEVTDNKSVSTHAQINNLTRNNPALQAQQQAWASQQQKLSLTDRNQYIKQIPLMQKQQYYAHTPQMIPTGYYPPPPHMPYYYHSQPYSSIDEASAVPSQFTNTQNMYMTSTGYMYPHTPYSAMYDPNMMLPQGQIQQFSQQNMNQELTDYLVFNESLDNEFDGQLNPNQSSQMSSIALGHEIIQSLQQAIVLEDTQCQLKGDLMMLYEGDKVDIVKMLPDMNMAQVKFNNEVGLFPISVLKVIKRSAITVSPDQSKNYHSVSDSKPRMSEIYKQKLSPEQQRQLSQTKEVHRNNFFKQPLQLNDIQNTVDPSLTTDQKSNLKLHDRIQKKKERKQARNLGQFE